LNHNQAQGDLAARIEQLLIYPVKSCAGIALPEVLLTDTGLDLDRAWMVVDADGEFVTQREAPRLALVQPQLKADHLALRAPGMLALHIAIDRVEQPLGRTSSNPLPPDLLRGKFVACAGHVLDQAHAVEVAAAIEGFEAVADVAAFTRMLEPV
jgi:hypothetical protein